jgi:hypothetical protein
MRVCGSSLDFCEDSLIFVIVRIPSYFPPEPL